MKRHLPAAAVLAALTACSITPEGTRLSRPPAAVQGSNDAQGAPASVPGAGMGVGSGNPSGAGTGASGPVNSSGR